MKTKESEVLDMTLCGIHFTYDTQKKSFTEVARPSNQQPLSNLDFDGEFYRGYLLKHDNSLVNEKHVLLHGSNMLRAIAFTPELIDPNTSNRQVMKENEFNRSERLGVTRFDEHTLARMAGTRIKVDYPIPGYELNVEKKCFEKPHEENSRIYIPSNATADEQGRMCYVHNPGDKFLTPFNSHPMVVHHGANVVMLESLVKMDPIGYADAMKLPRTELLSIYPVEPSWKIHHYPVAEHELTRSSSNVLRDIQDPKPAYNNKSRLIAGSNRQSAKPKKNKGQRM